LTLKRWMTLLLALSIVALVAAARVPEFAWRLQVLTLKGTGKIHDLSWVELLKMLVPGSPYYIRGLVDDPNPYSAIRNPYDTPQARRQGAELFHAHCGGCHGLDARGGNAPDLVGRKLNAGDSNWALFRTTQRGVPGTAMAPVALSDEERWSVIAHLSALRDQIDRTTAPSASEGAIIPSVDVDVLEHSADRPQDWLTYSGSYDSWRYSALDQINERNVAQLRLAWAIQIDTKEMIESSPLVIDGVMFLSEPPSNVRAVDAATGHTLWSYRRSMPDNVAACCGRVNRGVAVFGNRIYIGTLDAHLVALDAKTGSVIWDVEVASYRENFSITAAPLAVRGKIIVGVGGGDYGIRGFIDAYDAASGARVWRFEAIPKPGEFGGDTWSGDSWRAGGGATWLTGSFDAGRRQLYWGIGNPAPDFDGSARLGDNLFTNSVVALDVETGARTWHFQFTPHDEHDWDSNQIPVLIDHDVGGTVRPLMLWANRNGFYYVLDRSDGRLIAARAFAKQNWAKEIGANGRPILSEFGEPTETGVLTWPGASGATNWWAPSYNPRADLFFVPVLERPGVFFRGPGGEKPEAGVEMLGGGVSYADAKRTSVIALAPVTGERVWSYEMPLRTEPQQRQQIGGILTTAGDVLFVGDSETFYALRTKTGEKLWSTNLGGHINASPVTFAAGGRQLVVIPAGNVLFAFEVPASP
jgi:alcohol dehydrogenase (cytochrome c)